METDDGGWGNADSKLFVQDKNVSKSTVRRLISNGILLLWFWNGRGRFRNRQFFGGLGWSAILPQLRGRHFSAGRVNEDLDGAPTAFRAGTTLFPHAQRLEPPIVETEILNKVLADHQGTTLG